MACSSAKVERNSFAIYDAKEEEDELADGIEFGGYVMSRIGEYGCRAAVVASPGTSRIVNATSSSSTELLGNWSRR